MGTTKDAPWNSEEATWGLRMKEGRLQAEAFRGGMCWCQRSMWISVQHVEDRQETGVAATK